MLRQDQAKDKGTNGAGDTGKDDRNYQNRESVVTLVNCFLLVSFCKTKNNNGVTGKARSLKRRRNAGDMYANLSK